MYKYAVQNLHRKQVHVSSVPRHCVHQYIKSNWRRDRNSCCVQRARAHDLWVGTQQWKVFTVLHNLPLVCLCVDVNKHKWQRERNKRNHNTSLSTIQKIYISFVIRFLRLFIKIPSTETVHLLVGQWISSPQWSSSPAVKTLKGMQYSHLNKWNCFFQQQGIHIFHSGGGPVHARVPIHTHPQFFQRFVIFHRKAVYHDIDNYQIDHTHW